MKVKAIAALAISTFMGCAPAHAHHTQNVDATITRVDPIYQNTTQHVPQEVCEIVQVPIYGTVQGQGASGGDVLGGMILGALLGKGITNQDNGAAAGAVLGGVIAADKKKSKQVVTGYQNQEQCRTVFQQVNNKVVTGYQIHFTYDQMSGTAITSNKYNVGQKIKVKMGISLD